MIVSEVEGADWQTRTCREHSGSPHGAEMLRAGELCVDGEHCLTAQHGDVQEPRLSLTGLSPQASERSDVAG